ncbi:MAG: lipid A biosynthesis acyltransferase [Zoogloeaceae bacterium]|jgi:KDO2-lipid IV(A) lauroyltransferase|nr:lipid A biosynthesis acyltransferase [Zoogloeaceae bacterium]
MEYLRAPFSSLLLGILWLLHGLPFPWLRVLGAALGRLMFHLARRRRHIARVNLGLCFPGLSEEERETLLRRHFIVFAQALVDHILFWWASPQRLRRHIHVEGMQHLVAEAGRPVLILAPHFVGLDAGGVAVALEMRVASMYSNQKNPVFNRAFLAGRQRFNAPLLLSRQEGARRLLKAMKEGLPLYYLPDMDFGRKESIFVPFFGVLAATITGVSRLVRASGAKVIPVVSRLTPQGYEVRFLPPWEGFPGESVAEDTAFMNRMIETQVLAMPEQYYWLHKRFKTRPAGEPGVY